MGDNSESGVSSETPGNKQSQKYDFTNPLYLHNNEAPGTSLVTQNLTGSDNYNTWCMSMKIALESKNKIGFIDGTLVMPVSSNSTYHMWKRVNSMVVSWIINSVSKEIAQSIIYITSAYDIWIDLKERFSEKNNPKICQLKLQLCRCTQNDMTVNTYFTKLRSLWDEYKSYTSIQQCSDGTLCSAWKSIHDLQEMEYTMQFLIGLNESYAQIKSQILLYDPLPSINKVFSLVIQEERQRGISNSKLEEGTQNIESCAFYNRFDKGNHKGNAKNNFRKDKLTCTHCGYTGHTMDKCYKIHGYPPGFKSKRHQANICTQGSSEQPSMNHFKQMMEYFSQMSAVGEKSEKNVQANACVSQQGLQQLEDDWDG